MLDRELAEPSRSDFFLQTQKIGCKVGRLSYFRRPLNAGVAQLVEHFLAKEDVASSSLVTRSTLDFQGLAHKKGGRRRLKIQTEVQAPPRFSACFPLRRRRPFWTDLETSTAAGLNSER